MTDIAEHRCTEAGCPHVGQRTTRSCLCHKSREQMLMERIGELEEALAFLLQCTLDTAEKDEDPEQWAVVKAMRAALTKEPSA